MVWKRSGLGDSSRTKRDCEAMRGEAEERISGPHQLRSEGPCEKRGRDSAAKLQDTRDQPPLSTQHAPSSRDWGNEKNGRHTCPMKMLREGLELLKTKGL